MPPTYPLTGVNAAEVEARLAVMRLAQTRLGYMNPVLRITIGGTDRTTQFEKTSVRITRRTNTPTTATLSTILGPTFTPAEGQIVIIGLGAIGNVLFGGHITDVKQSHNPQGTSVKFSLSCQDYTWLFDRRQVTKTYGSSLVSTIVADIIASFTTGFTSTHVEPSATTLSDGISFTMEKPSQCLKRLADKESGATFYIDPSKDVHFGATDRAPNPHNLTSSFKDYENVVLDTDLSQVVTRVYVEGAGSVLSGYSGSGWVPGASIVVDDASVFPDPGTTFDLRIGSYMPVNGRRLRYQRQSLVTQVLDPQSAGDSTYTDFTDMGPFPNSTPVNMWLMSENTSAQTALAALEGGDGIHESYIQDRRLSATGMQDRATDALLNSAAVDTLTYRTHDPSTRPGAKVTVSLASPVSISGTFTIESVTITGFEEAALHHPWYEVEASSKNRTIWDVYRATLGLTAVEGY